jgi:hypothetical protein
MRILPLGEKAKDEEAALLEGQASGPQQPAEAFWDELLKNGYQDLQQIQMAALGKGKRERRKVSYHLSWNQPEIYVIIPPFSDRHAAHSHVCTSHSAFELCLLQDAPRIFCCYIY